MKVVSCVLLFCVSVGLLVETFGQDEKGSVGKLSESKDVPPVQRIGTDVVTDAKEKVKGAVKQVEDCTYGYCGGAFSCCEGYFCDSDSFCREDCENRTCYEHPDQCCIDYYCYDGQCVRDCSTSYCDHGEVCCSGYYCDGSMCQRCSTASCQYGESCCDGYYCDGYWCVQCSTSYCGHGEQCCAGYYCDGYMCRSR